LEALEDRQEARAERAEARLEREAARIERIEAKQFRDEMRAKVTEVTPCTPYLFGDVLAMWDDYFYASNFTSHKPFQWLADQPSGPLVGGTLFGGWLLNSAITMFATSCGKYLKVPVQFWETVRMHFHLN
jgi:hypothetical protein